MKLSRCLIVVGMVGLGSGLPQICHAEEADTLANYEQLTLNNLPGVGQVIQASLKALPRDLGEVRNWTTRMRLSALLPQLQARYRWFQDSLDQYETVYRTKTHSESESRNEDRDQDELISRVHADPLESYVETQELDYDSDFQSRTSWRESDGPYSINSSDELAWMDDYQITATWNLSALVFSDDELQAAQVNRIVAEYRFKHMESVATLYSKLQAALDTLSRAPANVRAQIQRDATAAMLDVATDGYLSDYVKNNQKGGGKEPLAALTASAPGATEVIEPAVDFSTGGAKRERAEPTLLQFNKKEGRFSADDGTSSSRASDEEEDDHESP